MHYKLSAAVLILYCFNLIACNTVKVERFDQVQNTEAEMVYIKPDVDFSTYRRLLPMPLEIGYSAKLGNPDPAKLQRIRSLFRSAFLSQVADTYEISEKPAEDVLRVRASLLDLKINQAEGGIELGGKLKTLAKPGKLTFLMEVQDSLTNEVLLRAGDTEVENKNETLDEWADVERAATRWAGMFRRFLDTRLGQPSSSP